LKWQFLKSVVVTFSVTVIISRQRLH